jgi:hypothetical protein
MAGSLLANAVGVNQEIAMTEILDLVAAGVQLAGLTAILYGAVYALELDVLVDRALKVRPEARPETASA